jgi:uncharacterized membrane protein
MRRAADDEGTVALLIVFFGLIIAALVTVIVDTSTVFLAERQLQSLADGAAAAAAQRADLGAIYGGAAAETLPLSPAAVSTEVSNYLAEPAHRPHECHGTQQVVAAQTDGRTVTVHLRCQVPLPFVNVVSQLWSDGVTIDVVADAESVVRPAA